MEMREAIDAAKKHLEELFQSEGVTDVQFEEYEFDEAHGHWLITCSFMRKNRVAPGSASELVRRQEMPFLQFRTDFKVVKLDNRNGRVLAVTSRSSRAAAE